MRFKAIIFDLDGTLLNTLDDLADSVNHVLKKNGYPSHATAAYRYFVGDGVRVLIERVLPEEALNDDIVEAMIEAFREEYGRNWNAKTRPYDGVPEMLDEIAGRHLKMAVLSNKPDKYTKMCVTELLPRWQFDVVVGAKDSVPRKPHPAGAIEVTRSLGVEAVDILYVGDTDTDMQTAMAAGMFAVGALWGYRTAEELERAGARELIEKPRELLKLL
jgi:phosphoglycolate phosphatase